MKYFVYILECSDNTLYTGTTNDVEKRVKVHNLGKGAKYTRGRVPVVLKKVFEVDSKSEALSLEIKIKKMNRREKLKLISDNSEAT